MIGKDNTSNNIAQQYSKEIKLKFLQFLKKHNAIEKYKRNIIKNIDKRRIGDVLSILSCKKLIETNMRYERGFNHYRYYKQLINYAFCWSETSQGHDYWENLNNLWENELEKFIIGRFKEYETNLY